MITFFHLARFFHNDFVVFVCYLGLFLCCVNQIRASIAHTCRQLKELSLDLLRRGEEGGVRCSGVNVGGMRCQDGSGGDSHCLVYRADVLGMIRCTTWST